jgi:hypothetical protein
VHRAAAIRQQPSTLPNNSAISERINATDNGDVLDRCRRCLARGLMTPTAILFAAIEIQLRTPPLYNSAQRSSKARMRSISAS